MDRKTFLTFIFPAFMAMSLLIAIPLGGVVYLSTQNSYIKTEFKTVTETSPLFGTVTKKISQPVVGDDGLSVRVWENVGFGNYRSIMETDVIAEAVEEFDSSETSFFTAIYDVISDVSFLTALEFTLIYTFITTPLVIIIGFVVALAVNKMSSVGKLFFIPSTLLPFIVAPVIGALAIKWLFMDNAVLTVALENLGFGKIYFLESKWTTRFLIILYGVWHSAPFAFIVFYAGLQTVPEDSLEAARIDGATKWQQTRYVTIPHLAPLFVFILLIYIMDAYRIFEPVYVFSGGNSAISLQYLTYDLLATEGNFFKSSAAAVITVGGVLLLLAPAIVKIYREYRRGF